MTTAQLHQRTPRRIFGALLMCAWIASVCSCSRPVLEAEPLVSPYTAPSQVIIAVAPLLNESGTTIAEKLAIADSIVNAIQGIEGLSAIPVNRTIAAMRSLGMHQVFEPDDALAIARLLGADGIIIGTLTAWQPYDPPEIGMSLALFASSDALWGRVSHGLDPRALSAAQSDYGLPDSWVQGRPVSVLAEFMDADDPRVKEAIERYAATRNDPPSALGARRYSASMKLYAKFVSHELVGKLLDLESARLTGIGAREKITERR